MDSKNGERKKGRKLENLSNGLYRPPHVNAITPSCNSSQAMKMHPTINSYYEANMLSRIPVQVESGATTGRTKDKPSKLLSSKSLSQLIPKSLFFKSLSTKQSEKVSNPEGLPTTKSLPSCPTIVNSTAIDLSPNPNQLVGCKLKTKRSSLIGIESNSTENYGEQSTFPALDQPNMSPIVGCDSDRSTVEGFSMYRMDIGNCTKVSEGDDNQKKEQVDPKNVSPDENESQKNKRKFKPFKTTSLVLRDVKNSLTLRMRAKHDSQAFSKLTNELATPPTKLYSPFNIYLDSAQRDAKRKQLLQRQKALDLSPNGLAGGHFNVSMELDCSMEEKYDPDNSLLVTGRHEMMSAKQRIALQHKKHLIQANKFAFDSPTGRLRETVKDVRQFQQCIEDISRAIKARERPTSQ